MSLDDRTRQIVCAFRAWLESAAGSAVRCTSRDREGAVISHLDRSPPRGRGRETDPSHTWAENIQRHDREDESTFATRWEVGRHLWLEVAIRPFLPQVRVGVMTDDPFRSRDFEQLIEEAGLTIPEFVAEGFALAGLAWPDPPVEHYREQGERYYFATPLDLKSVEQLADEPFRQKTLAILAGYGQAFSPIHGQ